MPVNTVNVVAGFRFVLTDDDKWEEFCHQLHEHVHGDDECSECSDSGSEHSGSDSGSDSGSEHSDSDSEHSEHCDHCDDEVDECEAVWDNVDEVIKGLQEKFPELTYNAVKCFHSKEGADRMIDIGFEFGNFSISCEHEGSHEDLDKSFAAIKEAKKVSFQNALKESPFWKYCTNKKGPQVFGQADGCVFCE